MLTLALTMSGCGWRAPAEQVPPPPTARPPRSLSRAPTGLPDAIVDCNGGGDFTTISAAITAAVDKTWIQVEPCTYNERIDYRGKTLWISSSGGSAVTTIDGSNNGAVVTATRGEGDGTALVGFTLDDGNGEAVELSMSAMRLEDIVIHSTSGNYAIYATSSDLELINSVIDDTNDAWSTAVYADRGPTLIRGSTIHCGTGDGLFLGHNGFIVDWSTVECPGVNDEAIEIEHGVGRIQRSTLTGDLVIVTEEDHLEDMIRLEDTVLRGDATVEFGTFLFRNSITTGTLTFTDVADTVTIENSIFLSAACSIDSLVPLGPIVNNDFFGPLSICNGVDVVGTDGNLAVDPLFVNAALGDLHLQAASPLIDAGVSGSSYEDVDGSRNDMGVYGGKFSMDGGW